LGAHLAGYGQQTGLFAPHLAQHYQLGLSSFYGLEGARITWDGIPVFPGMGGEFGNESLVQHAKHHFGGDPKGGLVVTLMDVWVLDPQWTSQVNCACWCPVDHEPAPPKVVEFFMQSDAVPIAMSRFGESMLGRLDPLYVPHAIDTEQYKPYNKRAAREEAGAPRDAFLVGMVAANKGRPSRKGFTQAFLAFRKFAETHDNAYLYLHTMVNPGVAAGENILALLEALGIPKDRVLIADQYRVLFDPYSCSSMAKIYSTMDVLLNPAMGEGFGIPVLEAQACFPAGTPVRVEDPLAVQCRPYTGRLVKIETARGSFEATSDHPVWTQRGWQSAGSIRPGDQLLFSHAPERLDEIHTGAVDRVARSLQEDDFGRGGSAGWNDQERSVLAATESRAHAQAVLGAQRTEASDDERIRAALLCRPGGWRGNGDDSPIASWEGAESQLQAVDLCGEYRQAHDGLDSGTSSRVARCASEVVARNVVLPVFRGGAGTHAALSSTSAAAGHQRRLDGGGHRVVRDPLVAITSGPLDDTAARNRLADPRAEYDSVTAVSERDVRDLPVYNFTTRNGVYEVGAGYLVHNCGTPAIVTDFSAMREVCGAGWHVEARPYWTGLDSWQAVADVDDIVSALEECYSMGGRQRLQLSSVARKHADGYALPRVLKQHMLPALRAAEQRFSEREPVRLAPRLKAAA
jgi:glycosyltransferase involved in cell wall biosynthesis